MRFTDAELDRHIRRRPSVQKICLGAFLQHPMPMTSDVLAVPLTAVGFAGVAKLVAEYMSADLDLHITVNEVEKLIDSGNHAYPGVSLVWHPVRDAAADELLRSSGPSFARAQRLLSLVTGDRTEIVANIVLHDQGHEYELIPTKSRRRQRSWFSESEAEGFQKSVVQLSKISESDSRVSLALQLYLDAVNDKSDEFRLVKLYNVLECLASPYKVEGVGSRDAVRRLLGISPGPTCSIDYKGAQVHFDLISVAGRIRDKIMHGARIDGDTFAANDRGALEVLAYEPFKLADELQVNVDNCLHRLTRS